jgi:hypothetical protein
MGRPKVLFIGPRREESGREVKGNSGRQWSSIKASVTRKETTSGVERSGVGPGKERVRHGWPKACGVTAMDGTGGGGGSLLTGGGRGEARAELGRMSSWTEMLGGLVLLKIREKEKKMGGLPREDELKLIWVKERNEKCFLNFDSR